MEKNNKFVFNQKAVEYLAKLISSSDLTEAEYKCGDISIRFAKGTLQVPMMQYNNMDYKQMIPIQSPSEVPVAKVEESGRVVKSIMVGRIYSSPKPGADPFIKVGDFVKKDQVIFIVEAMKVMNNIKSPYEGIVSEILVKDGEAVEYDQVLIKLS
jgi:acetyl-CoA carboxylase biotin carboxyl carrier protein